MMSWKQTNMLYKLILKLEPELKLVLCYRTLSGSAPISHLLHRNPTSHLHFFRRQSSVQQAQAFSFRPCPQQVAENGIKVLPCHSSNQISSFPCRGFSEITVEASGKALHGLFLKGFVPFAVFYTNTLVNMYIKFGHLEDARKVFDEMPERNEASWNTMMSGYVRARSYQRAIGFFKEMSERGFKPSGFLLTSLATGCAKSGSMLCEGSQVHGFAVKFGLLSDVFVGTALLHFYGTYGFVSDSCKLFDEMPERNVVSWTSLMVIFSDIGESEKVIDTFRKMMSENISFNENTIALVVTTCGTLLDQWLGVQILGLVVKSGLEKNVSVANSFIGMHSSFGTVEEAIHVFDAMDERDSISWNSIVSACSQNGFCSEAFRYFCSMRHFHIDLNSTVLSALLTVCGSLESLDFGRGVHGLISKLGFDSNVCVGNTLLSMYSEAGKSDEAEFVFRGMRERDLISWNSMVACYAQNDENLKAIELFGEMVRMGKNTNFITVTSALAACSNEEFVSEGKVIHGIATVTGLQENIVVGNALVTLYGKSGLTENARRVLELMSQRNEVTWNALIGFHSESEEPNDAVRGFNTMREEGHRANYITIVNLLSGFSTLDSLRAQGKSIHGYIVKSRFDCDKNVQTSLVTMYAKSGDLNSSNALFSSLSTRHSITWNSSIAANAHHGFGEEALKLMSEMRSLGLVLDQFSLSVAISVSADLAILEEGQQLHGLSIKLGFESDQFVKNAAMDMYSKCGEMDEVQRLLPPQSTRTRLSWNILISSFARHGYFQKAIESFEQMLDSGERPDHVTFVSLLSACSHGGLVDEGLRYYASMTAGFGVTPAIEHCVCVIDLFGRSGRLTEAEEFITKMPFPPNDLIWRSLLSSSKTHRNPAVAKRAAERLLSWDPLDDSAYVLYSNVCASIGKWEDVETLRTRMSSERIKKQEACSWVRVKNRIFKFGSGDKSNPMVDQIYSKLGELERSVREAGYAADTSFALQDIDEEQKERNLWRHSERIALAFALISLPEESSTIKIFKNLRVCGDCHSVYKLVSGIVGRRIVLRDQFRFHHFNGGNCSCCDYW